MLTYVAVRECPGGAGGFCERLPTAPAIYAWFRTIRIAPNQDAASFVTSVLEAIEAPAAPDWRARLGPMHRGVLESRSELAVSKRSQLELLASNEGFRRYAAEIVQAAAVLQ